MSGLGRAVPPKWQYVKIYFLEKGQSQLVAKSFFDHYSERNWMNSYGNLLSNWKALAWNWIISKT